MASDSNSSYSTERIERELKTFFNDPNLSGITLFQDKNNVRQLTAAIAGPISTPYEGGIFHVDVYIPDQYPFRPPAMRFVTKIWHPNISSQDGSVGMNILKEDWSPALNLKAVLTSMQSLLSSPELDHAPLDPEVASQYIKDQTGFVDDARRWTKDFAKASSSSSASPSIDEKVQKLVDMGFPKELVKKALKDANGDEDLAFDLLCPS